MIFRSKFLFYILFSDAQIDLLPFTVKMDPIFLAFVFAILGGELINMQIRDVGFQAPFLLSFWQWLAKSAAYLSTQVSDWIREALIFCWSCGGNIFVEFSRKTYANHWMVARLGQVWVGINVIAKRKMADHYKGGNLSNREHTSRSQGYHDVSLLASHFLNGKKKWCNSPGKRKQLQNLSISSDTPLRPAL